MRVVGAVREGVSARTAARIAGLAIFALNLGVMSYVLYSWQKAPQVNETLPEAGFTDTWYAAGTIRDYSSLSEQVDLAVQSVLLEYGMKGSDSGGRAGVQAEPGDAPVGLAEGGPGESAAGADPSGPLGAPSTGTPELPNGATETEATFSVEQRELSVAPMGSLLRWVYRYVQFRLPGSLRLRSFGASLEAAVGEAGGELLAAPTAESPIFEVGIRVRFRGREYALVTHTVALWGADTSALAAAGEDALPDELGTALDGDIGAELSFGRRVVAYAKESQRVGAAGTGSGMGQGTRNEYTPGDGADGVRFERRPPKANPGANRAPPRARLAIVIDDWGYQRPSTGRFYRFGETMTAAVLPFLDGSLPQARAAREAGYEVILHLPMEAFDRGKEPGPGKILTSMSDEEIEDRVERAIDAIPGVVGVSNHMGSRATSDARVMRAVLKVVARRNLFFLDSNTAASSSVSRVARDMGVPYALNMEFLDNSEDAGVVRNQLRRAAQLALRDGAAIAIGHVRPGTASALATTLEEIKAMGVELVAVSELVLYPQAGGLRSASAVPAGDEVKAKAEPPGAPTALVHPISPEPAVASSISTPPASPPKSQASSPSSPGTPSSPVPPASPPAGTASSSEQPVASSPAPRAPSSAPPTSGAAKPGASPSSQASSSFRTAPPSGMASPSGIASSSVAPASQEGASSSLDAASVSAASASKVPSGGSETGGAPVASPEGPGAPADGSGAPADGSGAPPEGSSQSPPSGPPS